MPGQQLLKSSLTCKAYSRHEFTQNARPRLTVQNKMLTREEIKLSVGHLVACVLPVGREGGLQCSSVAVFSTGERLYKQAAARFPGMHSVTMPYNGVHS